MNDRYQRVLGLGKYQPKTEYVCLLPWASEFGWYIMNHVKRLHAYNHPKKIVCIKKGHECLFPTATKFFYDWIDYVPDQNRGGIVTYRYNEEIKKKILKKYNDVTFISPNDTSWNEKTSLAKHTFVPKSKHNHNFNIDVVITPRLRKVDVLRNYPKQWQKITNMLLKAGLRVGVCGAKQYSVHVKGAHYYSWNYIDVDTDVEMILTSRVVISQESGLAYLTMMCKKPLIIIDNCHTHIARAHRDPSIYFMNIMGAWNKKRELLKQVQRFTQ